MIIFILIALVFFFLMFVFNSHLHVEYDTFFKKGFKKISNLFGVYCYTGKQGTGKTYSAVKFVKDLEKEYNYKVISNIKSLVTRSNGMTLDNYIKNKDKLHGNIYLYENNIYKIIKYCTSFKDNDDNVLIFFDEIFTTLKKNGSLEEDILSFLSQMRKRGIVFVTTAQEWAEINITFRRYVRYQVSCKMFGFPFLKTAFVANMINDGDQMHWDNDLQEHVAPTIQTNFSKGLKSIIDSYDTYETIATTAKMN